MTTAYPTGLDALTNPNPTDQRISPSHAAQHQNENDAIEAIEAKLGVNGSAVTTSVDMALRFPIDFSKVGNLIAGAGTFRWYNDSGRTLTFVKMRVSAGTAPTGAAIIVDMNIGGTTVFSTQANRPQVAAGANTGTTVTFNTTTIADGSYLTIDIDQIGSTIAGADLTVQVWVR
jgi:hypothetical protein